MKRTTKRILIIFSVCLNIGFIAMTVGHHLFGYGPAGFRPYQVFVHSMRELDMTEAQRQAMDDVREQLKSGIGPFKEKIKISKRDFFEALTAPGGPDKARLEANMESEMALIRTRLSEVRGQFVQALDILGPEKTRELGLMMIRKHDGE